MGSTEDKLVDLPMEQEALSALLLKMGQDRPLYVEVSDYCGRDFLMEHLPEDMDLTELNLLAGKLAALDPIREATFEGLVRMDLDKGQTELRLCRLIDLANSADCCHVAPGVGNDEQLGRFYVDNDFPVLPPGLPEEVYEVLDYIAPLSADSVPCMDALSRGSGHRAHGRVGHRPGVLPHLDLPQRRRRPAEEDL